MLNVYCLFTDWVDEQLPATNILRLIYQGRFLHGNVTLGGRNVRNIRLKVYMRSITVNCLFVLFYVTVSLCDT